MSTLSPEAALIHTMVLVSAADAQLKPAELASIGGMVHSLPVFADYDDTMVPDTARACFEMMDREDGLETILKAIKDSLPERLRETAFVLACDVIAADGEATQEELRVLEMLQETLNISPLAAAAIKHAAGARYRKL